ncbi:hypothetical protein [Hyphomicrobium sp. CS1BSMeth3]|uniref:hypothetical protein n=1 Tax=Hyphomicrobium sp. CS1BSMeth3 TaxID=1892844 RepID=UPI001FCDA464|nr:hypothetical protein [Hyphomicrobium sp. CS1BSMeth3]
MDQHYSRMCASDAAILQEKALSNSERRAADAIEPCADLDDSGPVHLPKKLKLQAYQDELSLGGYRKPASIVQQLHTGVLTAHREHGIGDVPVAIGVGKAQLLVRSDRIVDQIDMGR